MKMHVTIMRCKIYAIEIIALIHLLLLHLLLSFGNLKIPFSTLTYTAKLHTRSFLPLTFMWIILILILFSILKKSRFYLRRIFSFTYILLTFRIFLLMIFIGHFYTWLKLLVPIINPGVIDKTFWSLDRILMFGLSPNVFFLHLFSSPLLLHLFDLLYIAIFRYTLIFVVSLFIALPVTRIRMAFVTGMGMMWVIGAWLYLAFPSLGPCYTFSPAWDAFRAFLPYSVSLQKELMASYQLVLKIPEGTISPDIVLLYGIAAFPSLHVASQFLITLWVRKLWPALGFLFYVSTGILFFGSIVTGWHFLIDSLAGLFIGWICFYIPCKTFKIHRWLSLYSRLPVR